MITATVPRRTLVLLLMATPRLAESAWGIQLQQSARAQVLDNVNQALASDSGNFPQVRRSLRQSLATCPAGPAGRECRILYLSGLGSLLYRQAGLDRQNRDSLFVGAVAYYDRILTEDPGNSEAIYGKALSYRALGPHEWMEPFFKTAPNLDPGRSGLYHTFQGDYYAAERRWDPAARAYTRAVQQDPEDEGARAGLIEALTAVRPSRDRELLRYARDWEPRYPGSSADAYRAVLTSSFADGQGDAIADTALVKLVLLQAREGRTLGEVPAGVRANWEPLRQLREFLRTVDPYVSPWWMRGDDRIEALGKTAWAAGRSAVTRGKYAVAERTWSRGSRLTRPNSTIALDLQRELALLYFRHPELDPEGRKFNSLEQEIFRGKSAARAAGDLEASQRYHTVLALIYVERGVWKSSLRGRNAEDQLTWALETAEERWEVQQFYQPLPELRVLLARGLDSLGSRESAGRRYVQAAAAFLDTDELAAADTAAERSIRLGANPAGLKRVLALRSAFARGEAGATKACTGENIANTLGTDRTDFLARQQFKVLADCARVGPPNHRRQHAISAFRLVDRNPLVTLVGGGDLARFERVMTTLLGPFGVLVPAGHLDPAPSVGEPVIRVSLPGETKPVWNTVPVDAVIAARVVAELGSSVKPFPIAVSGGVLSVPPDSRVPPGVLERVKGVAGVRAVQVRNY